MGKRLAQWLDWDFVDLDAHIEAREQQTIAEIFRLRGEFDFRVAETSALRELTESLQRDALQRNIVVALGGGTFAQSTNRELLQSWPSVFLDAPVDELWERTQENAAKRPLRKDRAEFSNLHQSRLPFYRQATVTIVTSGKDPACLCAEIERTLHSWGIDAKRNRAEKIGTGMSEAEKANAADSSQSSASHFGTGEKQ